MKRVLAPVVLVLVCAVLLAAAFTITAAEVLVVIDDRSMSGGELTLAGKLRHDLPFLGRGGIAIACTASIVFGCAFGAVAARNAVGRVTASRGRA